MADNEGPVAGGPISPLSDQDTYGIGNDTYFVGGYRVVALLTDLTAITTLRRKIGMAVKVLQDGNVYELQSDFTTWVAKAGSSGIARKFSGAVAGLTYALGHTPDQTQPMCLYMGGDIQPDNSYSITGSPAQTLALGSGFGPIIGDYDNIAFTYFTIS